jgi:hypothetical protein
LTSRAGVALVTITSLAIASCGSAMLKNKDAAPDSAGTDGGPDTGTEGGTSSDARDGTSTCTNTMSDGKNCGVCGHDCLGGACQNGQCQPVLLAQYVGNMVTIYVGAQHVYATMDSGYIGRARKDGSDLQAFARPGFASSAFAGTIVQEDGDRVFFSRGSPMLQLVYCSASDCDATVMPIGGPYTQYFAVDRTSHKIFWVDYSPGQIWVAPTTGAVLGAAIPGSALANGGSGSRLLYSQGGIFMATDNYVQRIPSSGGVFGSVTAASGHLTLLNTNQTRLFVYDESAIGYAPLPNGNAGAPTPLITTTANTNADGHFAADDTSAYWVNNGAQTCAIANCSVTLKTLPSRTGDSVEDVGIDDQAVYWGAHSTNPDNPTVAASTVWKLAK